MAKYNPEQKKKYYKDNKEKILTYKKKYYIENKTEIRISQKHYYYTDEAKRKSRDSELKLKFKISIQDYEKMFEEQKGFCLICERHQSELKLALAVDHCHQTGKVRGLLCGSCNTALGSMKDNIEILKKGIKYLENKNR